MKINERIKLVRTSQQPKLSQTAFGERLGVSKDVIANLELGRVEPNSSILNLICMTFDVDKLWLTDGIGEMKKPLATDEELVYKVMAGESEFAKSVMIAFAKLGDEEWVKLRDLVEAMKKAGM